MKKISLLLLLTTFMVGTSYAGGSIFGGSKRRSSNPDGVSSVGMKICNSLNCPDVIIKQGDCGDIEHAIQQYGVCVCEEGYQALNGVCVPTGGSRVELDENGCYELTYKTGDCCDYDATMKICPGDKEPSACIPNPPEDCSCEDKSTGPGSAWECISEWVCGGAECHGGSNAGKCMYECPCDESEKPEGDAWVCDLGTWVCSETDLCPNGKCMNNCCGEKPEGDAWACYGSSWVCDGYECPNGKCMWSCG